MSNLPADRPDPAAAYKARLDQTLAESEALSRRAASIGLLRFVLFIVFLLATGAAYDGRGPRGPLWLLSAASLVTFIALVIHHGSLHQLLGRLRLRAEVNRAGLRRLDGTWADAPPPPPPPAPPSYAADLDLHGPASLAALIDTTQTRYGHAALWRALSRAEAPDPVTATRARQEAVRELSPLLELRQSLEVAGRLMHGQQDSAARGSSRREGPDPEPLLRWAEAPPVLRAVPAIVALRYLPLFTLALFALRSFVPQAPPFVGTLIFALLGIQLAAMMITAPRITHLLNRVASSELALSAYAEMLSLLAAASFTTAENRALKDRLHAGAGAQLSPEQVLSSLRGTYGMLELRQNPFAWFPLNVILLWDLQFALRLESWQLAHGPRLRGWLEALGEAEARASLSHLAHDNPDWTWPTFSDGADCVVQARELAHPLMPASRRRGNDVTISGRGQALLVTGSNMSGKSTLLRAIGLMQVMAQAGAAVCAKEARLPRLALRSVVRVDDSLARGMSHFYAELWRLKDVVDAAADPEVPLLYLLDEILHGTNTRERELGARLTIRTLCQRGALGVVTTHDLSLATLEQETSGAVLNYHFTEIIEEGAMRFDYKLREGPVRTSNALRLMRECGIALDWSLAPPEERADQRPATGIETK
jgi:hypothetical protein